MFSQLELFLEKKKNNAFVVILGYWLVGFVADIILAMFGEVLDHTVIYILMSLFFALMLLMLEVATGYTIYYYTVKNNETMSVNKYLLFITAYFAEYYISQIVLSIFTLSFSLGLFGPVGALSSLLEFCGFSSIILSVSEIMRFVSNFSLYQGLYGFLYSPLAIVLNLVFLVAGLSRVLQVIIYYKDKKRNNL